MDPHHHYHHLYPGQHTPYLHPPPAPTYQHPSLPPFHYPPTTATAYPSSIAYYAPPPHSIPTVYYAPSSSSSSNVEFPHYPSVPRSHSITTTTPIPNPNDDYLRRLRDEVIFLHGLWHQGPPNSNPDSVYDPVANFHLHLKPSHTTTFKKKKNQNQNQNPPVYDKPWPVPPEQPALPESDSGWPEFRACPTPQTQVVSEQDKARVSAIRAQKRGLDSFRSFFAGKHGPESESESESDDDHDQNAAFDDQFLGVFEGDEELKGYYLKNWGNGDFSCLVCGGSGQMVGRKYKNCVALIQHTVTISKTKKRAAHRAYGLVICKVLGWDVNQLHLVSRNLSLQQGNDISSAEACKDDPVGVETHIASFVNENVQSDPSTAPSEVGNDNAAEEKEIADLPSILDNPGYQLGNEMSSAEACKDDHVGVEANIASLVSENEQSLSDQSKATSDAGKDDAAEKKETSDLPLVLDNPQQGNEMSSAEARKDDPVSVEANIGSLVSENEQSDQSKATSDVGKDDAAEFKDTSDLPLVLDNPGDQQVMLASCRSSFQ